MKRTLALILAFLMLAPQFVSCGSGEPKETKPTAETAAPVTTTPETDPAETSPAETEFNRNSIDDNLPDVTFGGQEFRILSAKGERDWIGQYVYDEDLAGDALNSAIWKRNEDVEDRFDIKITAFSDATEAQDSFFQFVMADEDLFEVADLMMYMSWVPMIYNTAANWMDVSYIDWTKPWWNSATNSEATIKGKAYAVTGDLSLTSLTFMWILAFNMDLLEDWGHTSDEMYQLVFDGKWTLDKFIEICSGIYRDANGNSLADVGDIFGYATSTYTGTDPWVTAIDARIMSKDDEGELVITLGEEKVFTTLEKLINFFFSNEGCYQDPSIHIESFPEFSTGNFAIYPSQFVNCLEDYADLSFNYGILPYPKFNEDQQNYVTGALDQLTVYSFPVTVPLERYDFLGIIMEALNAESYKTVYPAYYDGALKGRYATDNNMAKVVDIIVESRMFDLAFMYGIYIERLPYQFRYCFRDQTTDLASKLASTAANMEVALEDLMLYYETGEQIWY